MCWCWEGEWSDVINSQEAVWITLDEKTWKHRQLVYMDDKAGELDQNVWWGDVNQECTWKDLEIFVPKIWPYCGGHRKIKFDKRRTTRDSSISWKKNDIEVCKQDKIRGGITDTIRQTQGRKRKV